MSVPGRSLTIPLLASKPEVSARCRIADPPARAFHNRSLREFASRLFCYQNHYQTCKGRFGAVAAEEIRPPSPSLPIPACIESLGANSGANMKTRLHALGDGKATVHSFSKSASPSPLTPAAGQIRYEWRRDGTAARGASRLTLPHPAPNPPPTNGPRNDPCVGRFRW